MGTRDRVMGDCMYLGPMEVYGQNGPSGPTDGRGSSSYGDKSSVAEETNRSIGGKPDQSVFHESNYSHLYKVDAGAGPLSKAKLGGSS